MRGRKTSDEDKERVRAALYMHPTASKAEISRISGVPRPTIVEMLKDEDFIDTDKLDVLRRQKKEEFIASAWDFISKALLAAHVKVDDLLQSPATLDKTRLTDITLAIAQLYDKQALASGEPTAITERKEPTADLVAEMEAKLTKLKQLTG